MNGDGEVNKMPGGMINQMPNYLEFNQLLGDAVVGGGGEEDEEEDEEETEVGGEGEGGEMMADEYCYHNAIGITNERSQSPAIVDLRINPRRMGECSETIEMHKKHGLCMEFRHHEASLIDYKNYNDIDSSQMVQYASPRLLKKMLQAPAGVNLKQLVSYDDSYDLPPIITNNDDIYDDSDTLTADSHSNIINDHDIDGNHHNNNWLGANAGDNIFKAYGNKYIY